MGMDLHTLSLLRTHILSQMLDKLPPDSPIHFYIHDSRKAPLISNASIGPIIYMHHVNSGLVLLGYSQGIPIRLPRRLGKVCKV
jgi:hypothetical protein